jgi:transposase
VSRLLRQIPRELGYLRSTWTSELLALEVARQSGVAIHASTIRRLLPRLAYGWRRARPALYLRDPRKPERLAATSSAELSTAPGTGGPSITRGDRRGG